MTRLILLLAALAASVATAAPAAAQPPTADKEWHQLNLGAHPQSREVSGRIHPELLTRSTQRRHVLLVTEAGGPMLEQIKAAVNSFNKPGNSGRLTLSLVTVAAGADGVRLGTFPPADKTPYYIGDDITEKFVWRSLGWIAPDLVVHVKPGDAAEFLFPKQLPHALAAELAKLGVPFQLAPEDGLAAALMSAEPPPALVGHIPAIGLTAPADGLADRISALLGRLSKKGLLEESPAHHEMVARRARTPLQVAQQLDAVYGHHLKSVMYQPALALVGRMNLDRLLDEQTRTADVEQIVADYASKKKPTLGKSPSGSVNAGHLVFSELAHRVDRDKYLPLVLNAANLAFDADGAPLPVMEAHHEMSDSVFMGGPILAAAGRLTGDEKYFAACRNQIRFIQNLCWRPDGIYRNSPLSDAAWGRGNGFPALGIAWALSEIPPEHPLHRELQDDLRKHLTALIQHQDATGMWHQVVDEPGAYREMTVTCMVSFAILRGLRNGWLDAATFRPVIEKSWPAIAERIAADGALIDVCTGTGKQTSLLGYLERPAILGRDERGGAMAFLAATEYAQWLAEQR